MHNTPQSLACTRVSFPFLQLFSPEAPTGIALGDRAEYKFRRAFRFDFLLLFFSG
jgi:hypothetical protein